MTMLFNDSDNINDNDNGNLDTAGKLMRLIMLTTKGLMILTLIPRIAMMIIMMQSRTIFTISMKMRVMVMVEHKSSNNDNTTANNRYDNIYNHDNDDDKSNNNHNDNSKNNDTMIRIIIPRIMIMTIIGKMIMMK